MTESLQGSISLTLLQEKVIACERCPRLLGYCREVAAKKRPMYRDENYWGKPLPSFGDPDAELLILGLAPAAHGGNRTGRMFTGDRSGDFLYRALCATGFANQPESRHRNDGLELRGCYITASLRCAPPKNKPLPGELRNCQPYLEKELELLKRVRAVLVLGRIAFDTYLRLLARAAPASIGSRPGWDGRPPSGSASGRAGIGLGSDAAERRPTKMEFPPRASFRFAHRASFPLPNGLPRLFASYHPSQQNTQTGKLTATMMRGVLEDIRQFLERGGGLRKLSD